VDNSPRSIDAESRFHRNVFAYNDVGLALQPSIERNSFWENTFQENLQPVSVQGGGSLRGNRWVVDGRGNYWSDYRGFDADGDGVGDVPYRAEALLDDMMDRRPELRLFQFGLAAEAVEFAANAFPALRPAPKLVDERPWVAPLPLPALPVDSPTASTSFVGVALGLLGLAGGVLGLARRRLPSRPARRRAEDEAFTGERGATAEKERGRLISGRDTNPSPRTLRALRALRFKLGPWAGTRHPAPGSHVVDGAALEVAGLTKRY